MKEVSPYSNDDGLSAFKNLSDQELWQHFLNGDKQAFSTIYETHVDLLFSYGMKVKYNRSLVKDCIHDLFVDLWKRHQSLSSTDNIKFYLYRSLRRKIRYIVDRERALFDDELLYNHPGVEVSLPFEHSLIQEQGRDEKKRKIVRELANLPARQQEVLKLIFFDELSYEEVSDIMSINVRSVYTLAWKALSALRKRLPEFLSISYFLLMNF